MSKSIEFHFPASSVQTRFDGPQLTSDGGLCWLSEADTALGLCTGLAACIPDWRSGPVRHSLETLVRQRVFQIACGYEDQDDADTLRTDPLLKLVCGRLPDEADLASQPTLSRLENAVNGRACYRLAVALVQIYLQERARDGIPERVILDFDGTDDPAYGHQEGVAYHGYYQQHIRGSRGARGPAEDTIRCWSLMATRDSSLPLSSDREQRMPARAPSPS